MKIRRTLLLLFPAVCLLGQTPRTIPLTGPDGKPVIGKDGKPATVTLSVVNPPDAAAPSVPPGKVVFAVGDEKLTAGELDHLIAGLPEQVRNSLRGPARRQFAERIVQMKLLAQEARKNKFDQGEIYKTQMAFQADNVLASLFFQDMMKKAQVSEADARAWYEQNKGDYERVQARHILIRMKGSPVPIKPEQKDLSEEEALAKAQAIRKQLLGGADFAALAKAESDDTGSGASGGDLGFFRHGQMVPSFEQAAFALPAGQISEPVKSQFGYHVIKVEAKEAKTFEEVRAEIEERLRPEAAQKALEAMRKSATVTLDPAYFGPETPAQPAAPAAPAPKK